MCCRAKKGGSDPQLGHIVSHCGVRPPPQKDPQLIYEVNIFLNAKQQLKQIFGYDHFKQGQEELIHSILNNQDCLGVMPTGAGKSICYQLPAAMLEGVSLVISPLISLIKDQVDALNQAGIPTAFINSSMTAQEVRHRFKEITANQYKIVYITPERLESDRFHELVQGLEIALVAVDEAHCVSQWGHDFRPSYMNIHRFIKSIHPRPVLAAFTATATDRVKDDIVKHLKLNAPVRVTTGYGRDNLSFTVIKGANKRDFLKAYVNEHQEESGIIYASTRKEVEACYQFLSKLGLRAGKYHAGMSDAERSHMQEQFLYDEIKVMVATNAFGMGIDKSNVRFVLHYNMPKNIESYYQEAGRAGRDGDPGECVLLFAPQDVHTQKFLIEQSESEERKQMEYVNLRDMMDYCHTTECLQHYIVKYFGELKEMKCGKCGSCTDDREVIEITEEAQKIFSCVVRMKQRFGMTLTAKVLRGAMDQKVKQLRFDQLPTHGVMKQYKDKEIMDLMNVLAAEGYLRLSDGKYPVLSLSPLARAVLEGSEKVYQRVQLVKKSTELMGGAGDGDHPMNEELFDQLRKLRKQFSDQQRVPPFTIFHDATLREMCSKLPQTEAEMLAIKGVGQAKWKKYGKPFLQILKD